MLAGDTLRAAADLKLPLVAVTLVSRAGYFHQEIDANGTQTEHPQSWEPSRWAVNLDAKVAVRIEDRAVWVGAWLYVIESHMGGRAPVILLDTDLTENEPQDREITHRLYGGDDVYRLKQEMVLGMGGVRILHALGFRISAYHMNEGHSALLGVELLRTHAYPPEDLREGESPYDLPLVRELCRFTTHTPVEAGHDRFPYELVVRLFSSGAYAKHEPGVVGAATLKGASGPIDFTLLRALAGQDCLNMTRLALSVSDFVNGVGKRHAELSSKMCPGYQVRAITNGVHPYTWTAESFRVLFDRYIPGWCHEPELLSRADAIPDAAILDAHATAKHALINRIRDLTGVVLDPKVATLGFARRMTAYKRPDLVFADLERLKGMRVNAHFKSYWQARHTLTMRMERD